MKLTLRKANAVQTAINEMIKGLDLGTTVALNEFEEVADQIDAVRTRFFAAMETRDKLFASLYEIRKKVARANAESGINDMLADVAHLEKTIGFNTMLAGKGTQTALRVLNGELKKQAEAGNDRYMYGRDGVSTAIFTDVEIADFHRNAARAKRTKQSLQDELLELNVQTQIELDEETQRFLAQADIL